MIKQDYLLRMIHKIIAVILNALMNRSRPSQEETEEFDRLIPQILGMSAQEMTESSADDIIIRYAGRQDGMELIELAALTCLMQSKDGGDGSSAGRLMLQQKAELLLNYLQRDSGTFSLQRALLLQQIKTDRTE